MIEDVDALHAAMLTMEPHEFVSQYIFEPIPFIFHDDMTRWVRWKRQFGDLIEVDPRDIVISGSACLGFSLNPNKNFRKFDDKSDIDCSIISPYHFEQSWRFLRKIRPSWLMLDKLSKRAIEDHRKNLIFSGTIATNVMLGLLPFGKDWQAALELMSLEEPTKGRDIKLRIYKDFDSLRSYQAYNISNLRQRIVPVDEELILTEE